MYRRYFENPEYRYIQNYNTQCVKHRILLNKLLIFVKLSMRSLRTQYFVVHDYVCSSGQNY